MPSAPSHAQIHVIWDANHPSVQSTLLLSDLVAVLVIRSLLWWYRVCVQRTLILLNNGLKVQRE